MKGPREVEDSLRLLERSGNPACGAAGSFNTPTATYRLQFSPSFGFQAACSTISYMAQLGISDVYASPIFKAVKGSLHGYDVVDPGCLNPELGGFADFEALAKRSEGTKWDGFRTLFRTIWQWIRGIVS